MAAERPNVSADLVWAIARTSNPYDLLDLAGFFTDGYPP